MDCLLIDKVLLWDYFCVLAGQGKKRVGIKDPPRSHCEMTRRFTLLRSASSVASSSVPGTVSSSRCSVVESVAPTFHLVVFIGSGFFDNDFRDGVSCEIGLVRPGPCL